MTRLQDFNLAAVIRHDMPVKHVVAILKDWKGPMTEKQARLLGWYFDEDRPRKIGAPRKSLWEKMKTETFAMSAFFAALNDGLKTSEAQKVACSAGKIQARKFKEIRSSYHRELAMEFGAKMRFDGMHHEDIIKEFSETLGISPGYIRRNILPRV